MKDVAASAVASLQSAPSFDDLARAFKGTLVTPGHPEYETAIKRWAVNAERRAKVVAFVSCPGDVVLALKYAKDNNLPLAIRGGGHATVARSSSEGLVIDLSKYFNQCQVDAEKKLAYVGGGALWETVDKAAIEHGLATVGGTVNFVGVGGSTLGGGYGWLSGQHGLIIDNLVQATMVTADGSILIVSETQNSDLFWAIRGGGCNFGVVCEFVYRLHTQRPTVYSGLMVFPQHLVDQVVDVTARWHKRAQRPHASIQQIVTRGPAPDYAPCIVVIPFFNGTIEDGRAEFQEFLDLGPFDLTREVPYEEVNGLQNEYLRHGQAVYMTGVTQREYSPEVTRQVFQRMCELSSPEKHVSMVFELYPLAKINEVSNDATAFNTRGASNVMCLVAWDGQEQSECGQQVAKSLTGIVANSEKSPEASKMRAYANYNGDDKVDEERVEKLFGDNYPRLQQIKAKYDSDMTFSKWFNIVPKLA